MGNCTNESWLLSDVYKALTDNSSLKRRIVIPMFQRGKKWSGDKEKNFIDSIKKNYPVGTLLFHRFTKDDQEYFVLIDGLQRGNTIKQYISDPVKYFENDQIPQDVITQVLDLMEMSGNKKEHERLIKEAIECSIKEVEDFNELDFYTIVKRLRKKFAILNDKVDQLEDILKPFVKGYKDDFNKVCNRTIPAIIYSGEEDTLPEIFERINSAGVALTQYEIYAASWPNKKVEVNNDEIINYILKKYNNLQESDNYKIHDYNPDIIKQKKELNLFEYVFGLSRYLAAKYEILNFSKIKADDEVNPMAFQLINACFYENHSDIKNVYKIIDNFSDKISSFENNLEFAIDFVDKSIKRVTMFKGNNRTKIKSFHSDWQIMSMISFVFRRKFDINNLTQNISWKEEKNILKDNIWKYYVLDIINNYWGEGGTSKTHHANKSARYLTKLSKQTFTNAINTYFDESKSKSEFEKISKPSRKDFVILNTIYANIFTANDQLSNDMYDVEHIVPKDQIKQKITDIFKGAPSIPDWARLSISHIANLCYLPEYINRSKGSKTIYQYWSHLNSTVSSIEIIEDKYTFTSSNDLEWIDSNFSDGDFDNLKQQYNKFIDERQIQLRDKFLNSLGYET